MYKKHQFTIMELLIVVAIIGILVTLLFPSLRKAREAAKLTVCMSNQSQISKRVIIYSGREDGKIPPYHRDGWNIDNGHNTRYFYYGNSWNSRRNLAHLWDREEDVDSGQIFFCPSQENGLFKFETYAPFPTASATPESGWSNRIRIGYSYNTWRVDDSSWAPRYNRVHEFDSETIMTTDNFTQAAELSRLGDIVSHSLLNSMAVSKGDGSIYIKKSKPLISTIRTGNWESVSDLNRMSQMLLEP